MTDEVYEDPSNNQVAVDRIKCIFGEGSNSSINGNLNKFTDKGSGNVAFKRPSQEGVTTSSPNKRNSKINIPAAFLKNNCESSMYKPPVLPKKVVQNVSSSESKDEVHPKVPTKPKFPTDKESAVAAIARGLKLAEAKENGDISSINLRKKDTSESEEGSSQPPTSSKPINPFLLRDQKRRSQSGEEKSESTPPWKAKPEPKPSTTDKPIPPWKLKNMQNQADGQKDSTPSWKTKNEISKTDVEKNDNLSSQETSKPLPPWKVKNLQNKSDSDKAEVMPPWKVKKEQTEGGSEEKTPSVVSKWKQQTQSSENTIIKPPFMKKNSGVGVDGNELSKVLGGLKKTSVVQNSPKEEGPPVIRNLKTNRKSIKRKSLTRQIDQKKFYSIDIDTIEIETVQPPPKPPKLSPTVNLDSIIKQYKALLDTTQDTQGDESEVLEQDEIYEELPEEEPVAIRRQSATNSSKKKLSRAVSLIPDMASDEEDEEYADTAVNTAPSLPPTDIPGRPPVIPTRSRPPPPALPSSASEEPEQEEYQDVGNPEEEDLEQDELYEPLDEIQNEIDKLEEKKSIEDKKKEEREKKEREKEEKERKEREEKERKEREKEEQRKQKEEKKRLEEERKRMEKDLKMWKKKFHVQQHELDQPQGEGDIKEDDKGGKNDLEVKKGMRVLLIRLTDNPKGKWLVKLSTSGKVGYVESSNVEVDNTLIKSVMAGDYMNAENLPPPPPELLADDAPEEEYADAEVGDLVQDEVYEEV